MTTSPRPAALVLLLALAACGEGAPATPDRSDPTDARAVQPDTAGTPPVAAAVSPEEAVSLALGVGDTAPDFELPDPGGRSVRLSDLLRSGPVVVAFYRGSWCPYCNTELRGLQLALPQIEAARARLVAVSPQTADSSVTIRDRQRLTYPVLSDVGNGVARSFGLVFQVGPDVRDRYREAGIDLARSNGDDSWELPVPATYVIAPDGTITYAFVEADYSRRAAPADVVAALREADPSVRGVSDGG